MMREDNKDVKDMKGEGGDGGTGVCDRQVTWHIRPQL
jgi:hypothetical protein